MLRVVVEVGQDPAPDGRPGECRRLVVQSRSISGALGLAEEHCLNGGGARVVFPIEPETFFVKDLDAAVGLIELSDPDAAKL